MCKHLTRRINIETAVCLDVSHAQEKLARKLGFNFKELVISAGQRVIYGVFHEQHVNAYHSNLKKWMFGVFHGIETKNMFRYLGCRRVLTESKPVSFDRLTNKGMRLLVSTERLIQSFRKAGVEWRDKAQERTETICLVR